MQVKYDVKDLLEGTMLAIATDGLNIKKFINAKFVPMLKEDAIMYIINTFKPMFLPSIVPYGLDISFKLTKKVGYALLELELEKVGEQTFQELLDLEPDYKEVNIEKKELLLKQTKEYFDETLRNQIQFTIIHAQTEMINLLEANPELKTTPEVLLDKLLISQFGLSAIGIKHGVFYALDKEYVI